MFELICLLVAFVLFVWAATGWRTPKINLIAAGLAFWVLVALRAVWLTKPWN